MTKPQGRMPEAPPGKAESRERKTETGERNPDQSVPLARAVTPEAPTPPGAARHGVRPQLRLRGPVMRRKMHLAYLGGEGVSSEFRIRGAGGGETRRSRAVGGHAVKRMEQVTRQKDRPRSRTGNAQIFAREAGSSCEALSLQNRISSGKRVEIDAREVCLVRIDKLDRDGPVALHNEPCTTEAAIEPSTGFGCCVPIAVRPDDVATKRVVRPWFLVNLLQPVSNCLLLVKTQFRSPRKMDNALGLRVTRLLRFLPRNQRRTHVPYRRRRRRLPPQIRIVRQDGYMLHETALPRLRVRAYHRVLGHSDRYGARIVGEPLGWQGIVTPFRPRQGTIDSTTPSPVSPGIPAAS